MERETRRPRTIDLEYEPGHIVAEQKAARRATWIGGTVVAVIVLLLLLPTIRSLPGMYQRWQERRAFAAMVERPAMDRFDPSRVTYAVPGSFVSRSSGVPIATYGTFSPQSLAVAKELVDAGVVQHQRPVLFAGVLKNDWGEQSFHSLAFWSCRYRDRDIKFENPLTGQEEIWRGGFFIDLARSRIDLPSRGGGDYAGGFEVWIAPPSAMPWNYDWRESFGTPLPLKFYGSYVDPKDPGIAVVPIQFGDYRGELRYDISRMRPHNKAIPPVTVRWTLPVPWLSGEEDAGPTSRPGVAQE